MQAARCIWLGPDRVRRVATWYGLCVLLTFLQFGEQRFGPHLTFLLDTYIASCNARALLRVLLGDIIWGDVYVQSYNVGVLPAGIVGGGVYVQRRL